MESENLNGSMDFESYRRRMLEEYQKLRPLYVDFVESIKSILKASLGKKKLVVASVEGRAKDEQSFAKKASKQSSLNPDLPKYKDPIRDITDLAGIRIITFFPITVDKVREIIHAEFYIHEEFDKADILKQEGRFGYQSMHYVVSLKSDRSMLTEYARYADLRAEIQVRTILQHAWAEIEHDIQYKSIETAPQSIQRRFMALAGLLEIADREFQAVQDEDELIRQKARKSVNEGKLENVEITPDALKTYLNKRLGSDGRMTNYSYEWTAGVLRKLGFTDFHQIDECISGYSDDQISRIVWGTRQGQLLRFEMLLLAGMGDNYIRKHPWLNEEWWKPRRKKEIDKLVANGIKIGNYQPPLVED